MKPIFIKCQELSEVRGCGELDFAEKKKVIVMKIKLEIILIGTQEKKGILLANINQVLFVNFNSESISHMSLFYLSTTSFSFLLGRGQRGHWSKEGYAGSIAETQVGWFSNVHSRLTLPVIFVCIHDSTMR